MTDFTNDTLEQVRCAVARIKEQDLAGYGPDDNLDLDSINRISLLAELENVFEIEISEVEPEVFESLASLSKLVEASKK